MFRRAFIPLMILALVICCMGQTFQYSRGWTNGKRSNTNLHQDFLSPSSGIIESNIEKKLEKCLINLQRLIHKIYDTDLETGFHVASRQNQIVSHQPLSTLNNNDNRHSNEVFDDFGTETSGRIVKRQTSAY